jgi:hypothetical protein
LQAPRGYSEVEYPMQQLGLLPIGTLTANGEWVQRRCRERGRLIAVRTCTTCRLKPRGATEPMNALPMPS